MGARSRHHLPMLVHDNEFDRVTRHACLCHVGGKRIECSKRVGDSLCSLCTVPCRPDWPPRPHHAKIHSGMRNVLLGGVAAILDLSPDVSATIASVELDWQVRSASE